MFDWHATAFSSRLTGQPAVDKNSQVPANLSTSQLTRVCGAPSEPALKLPTHGQSGLMSVLRCGL